MRQLLLTIFTLLTLEPYGQAQCPSGNVLLPDQEAVDQFIIDYPDCTNVNGLLRLGGLVNDINNLQPLQYIESVGGLTIGKTQLVSLEGLNNLQVVNGSVEILNNDHLITLQGLNDLSSAYHLFVSYNPLLQSLEGLDNLTLVQVSVSISNNDSLTNLKGLESLETISTGIGGELYISANSSLVNLEGLEGLHDIGGQLNIRDNDALVNLKGLDNLISVGGNFRIDGNEILENLSGLNSLVSVNYQTGYLQINSNPSLMSLEGLEQVTESGTLHIINNNSLTNLNGLNGLTTIIEPGDLKIEYNESLTSFEGLNNLHRVGRDTFIIGNPSLTSLQGLNGFQVAGCHLAINNNNSLLNFNGLENLSQIVNFNCPVVGARIQVMNNPNLQDMEALSNLTQINQLVFPEIINNSNLTDLQGLQNIPAHKFGNLKLQSSQNLSGCNLPNICAYLSGSGNNLIENNAPGCNSVEEILNVCALSAEDLSLQSSIEIYPNPVKNDLYINYKQDVQIERVLIYDSSGKLIYSSTDKINQINLSGLSSGIYTLFIRTKDGKNRIQKIIKQ